MTIQRYRIYSNLFSSQKRTRTLVKTSFRFFTVLKLCFIRLPGHPRDYNQDGWKQLLPARWQLSIVAVPSLTVCSMLLILLSRWILQNLRGFSIDFRPELSSSRTGPRRKVFALFGRYFGETVFLSPGEHHTQLFTHLSASSRSLWSTHLLHSAIASLKKNRLFER